jgi:spore maturation protein CgeB
MKNYAKNIEALHRCNPELAARMASIDLIPELCAESARNGEPTIKIDGIYLHSPYNPTKEAQEWAARIADEQADLQGKDAMPTILGFGLGYHLKALLAHGIKGNVIEVDLNLFRLALETSDLGAVLENFKLFLGLAPDLLHRRHGTMLAGKILPHPASLRSRPEYLGKLNSYAEALRQAKKGGLKILVVNPIYGGSLPAAQHCTNALRQMGHRVITFDSQLFAEGLKLTESFEFNDCKRRFQGGLAAFLSNGVEMRVRETMPDLVLALAQAPLLPDTLKSIDKMGIPTAFWFVEDYRVLPYWRETAQHYSYTFGIQQDNFAGELKKIGVSNYAYLPTAAAPDIHTPLQLGNPEKKEFGSDLSFVGAGYFNRQLLFKGLVDYPFKIWGSDWPLLLPLAPFIQRQAARIDTATCVKIFNASPINLNLHSSTHQEGVVPDGDFVNPRTFEIAACNAFQLVDRRSLLGELFAEDELETFSDIGELRGKIDHYLNDAQGRNCFAHKARQRVLAEHTYQVRMDELLATMLASFPWLAERHRNRLKNRSSILSELGNHEGLGELMERMPQGQWFSLDDVWRNIETGKNKISRAEKLFIMLGHIETIREALPQ